MRSLHSNEVSQISGGSNGDIGDVFSYSLVGLGIGTVAGICTLSVMASPSLGVITAGILVGSYVEDYFNKDPKTGAVIGGVTGTLVAYAPNILSFVS